MHSPCLSELAFLISYMVFYAQSSPSKHSAENQYHCVIIMYVFPLSLLSLTVLLFIKREQKKKKKPIPSDISHAMACTLPGDAMIAILLRSSVQSLLRLRNVSKSWNQLVKNNAFAHMHLNHSVSQNKISLLHLSETPLIDDYFGGRPVRYIQAICYDTFHAFINLRLPHNGYFEIVGCCNGVLCLTTDAEWWQEDYKTNPNRLEQCSHYLLINPATREHKLIQGFSKTRVESGNYKGKKVYGGFGFDSRTHDYKILRVVKLFTPNGPNSFAEIYNLSTDSWRKIDSEPTNFNLRDACATFFKGILHFEAVDKGNPGLITFNITREIFRKMKLPSFRLSSSWKLTIYKKQLAVICTHFASENTCFQIWIMQEYGDQNSWVSQMIVTSYNDLRCPVGTGRKGEILSVNVRSKLSMFDPDDNTAKEIHVWALVNKRVVTYTESLVTFGGSFVYPQPKHRNNQRKQGSDSSVLFVIIIFFGVPSLAMIAALFTR